MLFRSHFEALGLYVYASTESIVKKALKEIGWQVFPYDKIEIVDGDIFKIDRFGMVSRECFEVHNFTKFANWYYEDEEEYYYTMHEQLLFDYCNCYSVDPDDVALLLDYGYTCDEIEEILSPNENELFLLSQPSEHSKSYWLPSDKTTVIL